MARTEPLPEEISRILASKIGPRIAALASTGTGRAAPGLTFLTRAAGDFLAGGTPPSLAESFSLWMLDPGFLQQPTDDLRLLARPLGRWHHQIKFPDGSLAHARSQVLGDATVPDSWVVRELFQGVLAQRIDEALDEIDRDVPDRFLTRLLCSPGYLLNALWMIDEHSGEQKIRVLTAAPNSDLFRPGVIQDAKDFLRVLRSRPSVLGLINDRPLPGASGNEIDIALHIRFHKPR